MPLRSFIFWPHLIAGTLAGVVILVMSATGVLLTYEKQLVAWADRGARVPADQGAERLAIQELLSRVRDTHGSPPNAITLRSDAGAPVLVTIGQRTWLVDPYSGATIGESAPRMRRVFRVATDWHRWLAVTGEHRETARAVTGWANVIFLFIVVSGMYLWLPRRWSLRHLKSIALISTRLQGKARDFNWHNAIGIWCAVPLFFIVLSITPVSFPWANETLFRMVGESPPARPGMPPTRGREAPRSTVGMRQRTDRAPQSGFDGIDRAFRHAEQQVGTWRTITLRLPPSGGAPLVFTIDRGSGGQPHLRGTLTVSSATGDVTKWEPFESQSLGRRVRSIARFLHTGEVLGIVGQTVAGLASLGGTFLVWTGLSLAYRRFFLRSRVEKVREREAA